MPSVVVRAAVGLLAVVTAGAAVRADDNAWAVKMLDRTSHDFGNVARGADVSTKIKVTNIYKETVHIANVKTSCGCTAANPDKTTLASLESAYIDVTMDTRKFEHQKDSNVIITFDQPLAAEVRVPISAYIRTDVVLTPGAVNFGPVAHGSGAEELIEIDYAGRSDWHIKDVRTNNEHLKAEVVERQRAGGRVRYELKVALSPEAPLGGLNQQITLITDDAKPYVPVLVTARVEADVEVKAPESLGTLVPGQEKSFNVVIRGRKPMVIESIECESDQQLFRVRLSKDARQVHVLPFTMTPPDAPGEFKELFTVTIEGRPEPVTFSVTGKVAPAAAAAN